MARSQPPSMSDRRRGHNWHRFPYTTQFIQPLYIVGLMSWLIFEIESTGVMDNAVRAIELVKIIERPQNPEQIQQASAELQELQQSPDGWLIADQMLASDFDNVRFYGALTLQIKLNKEGPRMDPTMAVELLERLLSWVVRLASKGERRMVLDKLCSTMATYFIQSPVSWLKSIRQVVCSLHKDRFVPNDELNNLPATRDLILQLPSTQQRVAVRFSQTLAEDMFNWASISQRRTELDDSLLQNTGDAVAMMDACFYLAVENSNDVTIEAMHCLNAWTHYAYHNWGTDSVTLGLVQQLTPRAANFLLSGNDDVRELAVESFVTNLDQRVKFFTKEHLELISKLVRGTIGPECAAACLSGYQEASIVELTRLVVSYGRVTIKEIVAVRRSDFSAEIVGLFQELLIGPGYPAEDDPFILHAIMFWIEYAEHLAFTISGGEPEHLQNWLPIIRDDLLKAMRSLVPKLSHPPADVWAEWDEDVVMQWKSFRENVAEYLEFLAEIPDSNIHQHLIQIAMQTLPTKQWLKMEGILFCINAVAEFVNPTPDDPLMQVLMGSSIFSDASDSSSAIPVPLRRAVLRLIDGYSTFIKSNIVYIPPVLTFLFTILETTPPDQASTADHAAKAFKALASSCRRALTEHLAELLQQCPRALSGPSANSYQKEKVMAALASIIQALPSDEAKVGPLLVLLEVVEADLNAAVQSIEHGDMDNGELMGTTALQCLASMAKGIQALDDAAVNLDSDDEETTTGAQHNAVTSSDFWTDKAGAQVQARILACFQIVSYLPNAGDALAAACSILSAGLKESVPGPFVFPPQTALQFIVQTTASLQTPRIETILGLACTFVSAYSRRNSPHLNYEIGVLHNAIMRLMSELDVPGNDPAIAHSCIEFLQRLLNSYLDVLLAPDDAHIAGVMNFVIASINDPSSFLKRQACSFLETLIGTARPGNPAPLPQTRVPLTTIIAHFAPTIATALMYQVAGLAQRSELEAVCKPLRAFVFGVPNARRYLEEALVSEEADAQFVCLAVGTASVTITDRKVFVAKVAGLRGSRQTLGVVRDFWAACKGTVSSFK